MSHEVSITVIKPEVSIDNPLNGYVYSGAVRTIVTMTRANYEALPVKVIGTLYLIVG